MRTLVLGLVLVASSCSPQPTCVVGTREVCSCAGGSGFSTCGADGFGACLECDGADAGSDAGLADPELTCATAPQSATLASNVQAVFDAKCKDCHEAQYTYGDFTTAERTLAATTDKKSLYAGRNATLMVVDGANKSLSNSALWLKVLGGAATGRAGPRGENVQGKMPNDTRELTAQEKQLIKDWICSGGK